MSDNLRDQITETLVTKSFADWPDEEAGLIIEIPASDATDAILAVIKERVAECWPDPFGNWSADQADAAKAMKEHLLRLISE